MNKGFTRVETGAAGRGTWHNKYFKRDQPELMKHMKRIPVKNSIQEQRIPTTATCSPSINSEELLNTARHQLMLSMVHHLPSRPNPWTPVAHQYLAVTSFEQQHVGRLPTIIFPQRNLPRHGSFHTAPSSSSTPSSASVAFVDRNQSDVILPNSVYQHQQRPFFTNPLRPPSLVTGYSPGTIAQQWLLECSRNPTTSGLVGSEHGDTAGDNISLRGLKGCNALLPALNSVEHRNSDINAANLVSILENRRQCTGTSSYNAVDQDLLSALAWREFLRQRGP